MGQGMAMHLYETSIRLDKHLKFTDLQRLIFYRIGTINFVSSLKSFLSPLSANQGPVLQSHSYAGNGARK